MTCKFHPNQEPIALCKRCDCGICKSCVAFADFSGLCPYCYLDSLKEKSRNYKIGEVILGIFAAIFLLGTIFAAIVGGVLYSNYHDPGMLTFFTYVGVFGALFVVVCIFATIVSFKKRKTLRLLEQKKRQLTTL